MIKWNSWRWYGVHTICYIDWVTVFTFWYSLIFMWVNTRLISKEWQAKRQWLQQSGCIFSPTVSQCICCVYWCYFYIAAMTHLHLLSWKNNVNAVMQKGKYTSWELLIFFFNIFEQANFGSSFKLWLQIWVTYLNIWHTKLKFFSF